MDGDAKDRTFLEHAVGELKDYILSDQLFWPLGSDRLTIGTLLLALLRVKAIDPVPEQKISELEAKVESFRSLWRTNWSNKSAHEFKSRLRQWELALNELLSRDQEAIVMYKHEVTLRVLLQLLENEIIKPDDQDLAHLKFLDQKLHSSSTRHDFVWDPVLKTVFPEQPFWYLYVQPRLRAR